MYLNRSTIFTIALGLMSMAAAGCSDDTTTGPSESTVYGTSSTVAGGTVRSFMKLDASGNPLEIGLRISKTTVDSVPMTPPANPMAYMYHIALPAGMATKTAIQDISLDWGPMGHPPFGIYDTAHFDIHFYMVPMAERMAWPMDTSKLNRVPNADLVPAGHVTDGMGIPFMGLHYVDPTSGEFGDEKFNSTFIWGYYDGAQIFIEPMITQWFLQSKASFSADIKQPAKFSKTGVYYPTRYSVGYDNATNEHVITMSGMTLR